MTETLDKDQELEFKKAIETLLFITDQPISIAKICQAVGVKDADRVAACVDALRSEYEERGAAMQVLEVAEGFQMATRSSFAGYVRNLYKDKMTMRLSTAALETLAIIAYKQPITRAEIEAIRGVEVIAALETLLEKALVKVVGRKDSIGRPLLYGTSHEFLRHFGLRSVDDLPPFEDFAIPEVDESETRGRDPGAETLEDDASPELEAKLAEDAGESSAAGIADDESRDAEESSEPSGAEEDAVEAADEDGAEESNEDSDEDSDEDAEDSDGDESEDSNASEEDEDDPKRSRGAEGDS